MGFDRDGYRHGYNWDGYDRDGYDRNGYNSEGYDKEGYDKKGFNCNGIHKDTMTRYNSNGYDKEGYNKEGFNRYGYDREDYDRDGYSYWGGYDRDGYDRNGFNKEEIHKVTGTSYNPEGYDKEGYDKEGYNIYGYDREKYDRDGYNWDGYDREGYNKKGYNREGYHRNGFNRKGIHKVTGTSYNPEGYDKKGFNREGYNKEGYNKEGFNKEGYNEEGYDKEGYNKEGYNKKGYDREGYNKKGFDKSGIHKFTKTEYDLDGYDINGYDQSGYDKNGKNKYGKTLEESEKSKQKQRKYWLGLRNKAIKLSKGEMTIEEYIKSSKTSIEELIQFAKKNNMGADVVRGLYRYKDLYKTYTTPFRKKEFIKITTYHINGEEIKPTEQDVDKCIEYLKSNDELICHKTVTDLIKKYYKGEVDITLEPAMNNEELDNYNKNENKEEDINMDNSINQNVTNDENKDEAITKKDEIPESVKEILANRWGESHVKGIWAFYRTYTWLCSDQKSNLIENLDDFIELTTPIIEGRPRAKAVITSNMEGIREVSIQAGSCYASYPHEDNLSNYSEFEICEKGIYIDESLLMEYGQTYDIQDAYEGIESEKMYVLENIPKEELEYHLNSFIFLNEFETAINILTEAQEQFEEIGAYETSKKIKKVIKLFKGGEKEEEEEELE